MSKKKGFSSKYKKGDLSPEAEDVIAEAIAARDGTSVEEEKAKNRAAMDRDDAIEEATFAQNHPIANMVNQGGLVSGGETPQTNINTNKVVSAAATPDAKVAEEMKKADAAQAQIDGTDEMKKADAAQAQIDGTDETSNADNSITSSVSKVVTPKESDTPTVTNAKKNYNKSMMSIWDAYRNGDIDKETAGYFTIDAIATLAKNLGRSIGNVGAQFSGGTIDNGHDESAWEQRKNALLNEEIQKEKEGLGGPASRQAESEELDIAAKRIRNAYTPAQLENQIEMFKKELEMADINLDMAHSKTDIIDYIKKDPDYANNPFKMGIVAYLTQSGTAGAVNNTASTFSNAVNWMLTLFK